MIGEMIHEKLQSLGRGDWVLQVSYLLLDVFIGSSSKGPRSALLCTSGAARPVRARSLTFMSFQFLSDLRQSWFNFIRWWDSLFKPIRLSLRMNRGIWLLRLKRHSDDSTARSNMNVVIFIILHDICLIFISCSVRTQMIIIQLVVDLHLLVMMDLVIKDFRDISQFNCLGLLLRL